MLYRFGDNRWKITDFGLSVEGSSRRALTTRYGRGTASYRAPELLSDSGSRFNNKVDIWALGCISYELITRKRAFSGDHSVLQYALSRGEPRLTIPPFSNDFDEQSKCVLSELIFAMLQVDPLTRPSSLLIIAALRNQRFRRSKCEHVWISQCLHGEEHLLSNPQYRETAPDLVYLPPKFLLWTLVRWRRHWYRHS